MLQESFSKHVSPRKSFLWLLLSLITATVLIFSQGIQIALADIPDWREPPDDTPPVEPGEPPEFEPATNGFDWSVPNRFGLDENKDGLIDYHWDSVNFVYEQSLLYPESWPMTFYGCRTKEDANKGVSSTNTYKWELNGQVIIGNKCWFTYAKGSPNPENLGFPAQGTYPVTMTVTYGGGVTSPSGQNPEVFSQTVEVRDILIVSLGDSYASGEGIPDIPQKFHYFLGFPVWDADPVWQDKRCHRSANAGPALAALAIERMDPKTSVTFISFACSGATIGTELFDGTGGGDPKQSRGVGVLEPYIGQEKPKDFPYSSRAAGWVGYIPSQMTQLTNTLQPPTGKVQRQIDALTISGGGNDMHFAGILADCVLYEPCYDLPTMMESPDNWTLYSPRTLVDRALGNVKGRESNSVPENYRLLADQIAAISPAPLNVYLTQYPNLGTNDDGNYCRMLEDIFWPNPLAAIEPWETWPALEHGMKGLNKAVFDAARSHGWVYVDGLANYDDHPDDDNPNGSDGLFYRHGYCAADHYITRADEAELRQGPLYKRLDTVGTAHPNIFGTQAYSSRMLHYMLPRLFPQPPANPPAISAPLYQIGDLVDTAGVNGWYLSSCQGSTCYPKVVMQVIGTADAGVAGAGVTIGDVDACTVNGVTCRTDGGLSGDGKQYTWNIELNADGIYNFQFNLRDSAGAIATGGAEIKVDLHDPELVTPEPFTANEGGTVVLEASVEESEDSMVSYTWDLDNDGKFETYDQKPVFSAASLDGPTSQTIKVKATDLAGRTATAETQINVVNVAPSVEILKTSDTYDEGTEINLGTSVSDPGYAETFTYAWNIQKNGNDYLSGEGADFRFTPDDNGSYEVSLSVTDKDGGVGTASQTITVGNVAPTLSNVKVTPGTVDEGDSLTLSGSIADPGSLDSFTLIVAWGDGHSTNTSLAAGSTSFSETHTYADDNPTGTPSDTYNISVSIKDDDDGSATGSASVVVNNLAPSLTISAPTDGTLYTINSNVSLSATASDPSASDTLTCSVSWGDGATTDGTLTAGTCTASHSYSSTGVYTIQITVTDDDTGSATKSVMVVVYDPSAGFVTGGGWINSLPGAYKASLSGKANFGFVSKYQKGATVPTGNTAFTFQMGGFEFYSTAYEWLVVNQAGLNAQFKGVGLVNGALDPNGKPYKFMIWAGDGSGANSADTFRIRIWWEDAAGEHAVYDNGVAQAIGGGNIVVHTSK